MQTVSKYAASHLWWDTYRRARAEGFSYEVSRVAADVAKATVKVKTQPNWR